MTILLLSLLGALAVTNPPAALTNDAGPAAAAAAVAAPADSADQEFRKLMADDDAAQAEVDKWILVNQDQTARGTGLPPGDLNRRIRARFEPVRKAYEDFIARHPKHVPAKLAFASFLDDLGEEEAELLQLKKASELDPKNPAVWNQLANFYGGNGEATNAFADYSKAVELNPNEPVYYHNFGAAVYLFRKDAMAFFHLTEQQVFDKVLDLYAQALKLAPDDFPLASDAAQTYYGIQPLRTDAALRAWTNALAVARDDIEREGVHLHFARIKLAAGRFDEARAHLNAVTNAMYETLKTRLARNLAEQEGQAHETSSPPAAAAKQ